MKLDIYKVLKIMSSESKAQIIAFFMHCECTSTKVNELCAKFNLKQANVSKHLSDLHKAKVVDYDRDGKVVNYKMNDEFKNQWGFLINQIIEADGKLCKINNCSNCGS